MTNIPLPNDSLLTDSSVSNANQITEEMNIHPQWYLDAKNITLDKLPTFLEHLLKDYSHDYGTICHALTAGAIATIWAMNKDEQGGITGFQASAVMWEFIKNWTHKEGPLRLINYENMLYPQYHDDFKLVISVSTWDYLQKKAKEFLIANPNAATSVIEHWQSIINGKVPFDYSVDLLNTK